MFYSIRIILLFILVSCNTQKKESLNIYDEINCNIPLEIKKYIKNTSKKWVYLEKKDLKLLEKYVPNLYEKGCFLVCKGDFNANGQEDFAMIIRYTGYQVEEHKDYSFPFLIIFNDYKDKVKDPYIFYRPKDYNNNIRTIIYDQFEEGIYSYLEKGVVCNREVINVILPEKSSFKILWDNNDEYISLNASDIADCVTLEQILEKKNSKRIDQWQGDYKLSFHIVRYNFEMKGDINFHIEEEGSYVLYDEEEGEENLEIIEVTKDTIQLQNSEKEIYKIYKDSEGNLRASGTQIYLLNPPVESYPLTKEK